MNAGVRALKGIKRWRRWSYKERNIHSYEVENKDTARANARKGDLVEKEGVTQP